MPCSDSSSSISIRFDHEDRFLGFDFAKITCGREITAQTGYAAYCQGKKVQDLVELSYSRVVQDLNLKEEEAQFILYLEWDALRSALAEYFAKDWEDIDRDRCRVTSVDYTENDTEIALVILPPKELPKILPCSLAEGGVRGD